MNSLRFRIVLVSVFACGMICYAADISATAPATQPSTGPTTEASTNPSAQYKWDDAKNHVGEKATVTGPVVGTHVFDEDHSVILNIGKEYPDPGRFTVYIPGDNQDGLPTDLYQGKTVSVTGDIVLFKSVPEIKASPKDIAVVK